MGALRLSGGALRNHEALVEMELMTSVASAFLLSCIRAWGEVTNVILRILLQPCAEARMVRDRSPGFPSWASW